MVGNTGAQLNRGKEGNKSAGLTNSICLSNKWRDLCVCRMWEGGSLHSSLTQKRLTQALKGNQQTARSHSPPLAMTACMKG